MNITNGLQEKPPRIVLSGTNGVGKSTFASQMPKPLFLDLEKGTNHLDVNRVQNLSNYAEVLDVIHELLDKKEDKFKTLVIDSLDFLEALIHKSIVQQFNKREPGIEDISDIAFGKGYSHSLSELRKFLGLLDQLEEKNNMMICLICHTQNTTKNDPMLEPYSFISLKLHQKASSLVKEWSDFLLFANFDTRTIQRGEGFNKKTIAVGSDSRILHTSGSTSFEAKSRRPLTDENNRHQIPLSYNAFKKAYSQSKIIKKENKNVA